MSNNTANLRLASKNIIQYLIISFILFYSCLTKAERNNIKVYNETELSVKIKHSDNSDELYIQAANNQGISYNKLSSFKQLGNEVNIINNPVLNPLLKNTTLAPRIIILHIDGGSPAVLGKLNIIGKGAELIIVSESGVECKTCNITNSSRITLTTGKPIFNDQALTSFEVTKGRVYISNKDQQYSDKGLITNGASIIDIVADTIQIAAEIDTQLYAKKTPQQKLVIAKNGTLTTATGNLQLIAGHNTFNYTDGDIDINPKNQSSSISGYISIQAPIYTGGIYIESTGHKASININDKLITTSDLTLASIYKENTILPSDTITVKSFGDINITDKVVSGNTVNMESGNNINITQEDYLYTINENKPIGVIESTSINIAVVNAFYNYGSLDSNNIHIAAGIVNNEGAIFSKSDVYISSETDINNIFGGLIVGENIAFNTQGIINNGSARPYRLVPRRYVQNRASNDSIDIGTEPSLPDDPENTEPRNVESLAATILGGKIAIKTGKLNNYNPYFLTRNNFVDAPLNLNPALSDRVIIAAETAMLIEASDSVLNSSGIIEVSAGSLNIKTKLLEQERYHVETAEHITTEGNTKTTTNYTKTLSPLARIRMAGELNITADRIENKASGIEVLSHVQGTAKDVRMTGYKFKNFDVETITTYHSKRYCAKRVIRKCVKRKTRHWSTSKEELTDIRDGIEFPFIFYVNGNIDSDFGSDVGIYQDITYGPNGTGPIFSPTKDGAETVFAYFSGYEDRKTDLTAHFSEDPNNKNTIILSNYESEWRKEYYSLPRWFDEEDPDMVTSCEYIQHIPNLTISLGGDLSANYKEIGNVSPLNWGKREKLDNIIAKQWITHSFCNSESNVPLVLIDNMTIKPLENFYYFQSKNNINNVKRGSQFTVSAATTVMFGNINRNRATSNVYELEITDLSGNKKYLNVVLGHSNNI